MMPIVEEELKAVRQHLMCDCGGEYISTKTVLCTYPPQYNNICTNCKNIISAPESYPRVMFLPKED